MITVIGDHERPHDVDTILGFLLGVMGDVTAYLMLPAGGEATTLHRLSFLTYPIRVWTHTGGIVTEMIIPTRREVLSFYDDPLVLNDHDLGDGAYWVANLVMWADAELDASHRSSYLSWHLTPTRSTGSNLRWLPLL